ncbi:MAG: DNA polymerase III subunit gamma/tau, partial [Lysobacteraceae bacterium]
VQQRAEVLQRAVIRQAAAGHLVGHRHQVGAVLRQQGVQQAHQVRLVERAQHALLAQDGADLMAVADEMASRSLSYNGALQDLGTLLHRIALAQSVPAAVPQDLPELNDILRLAQAFDAQEVQLYYQIAVHGRNEIGLAPDEYAGFTMTLLRMLAFRPGQGGAEQVAAPGPAVTAAPVARAAAVAAASHAAVAPARPAPPATQAQAQPQQVQAPRPAAPVPAPSAPAAGAPPAMTSARAAINAALEAARAASGRPGGGGARRPEPAPPQTSAPAAAPAAAPAPAAPPPASPGASTAMQAPQAARPAVTGTPPWEAGSQAAPGASAQAQPQARTQAQPQAAADDEPPSWVTEFSDDTAVASEAPAAVTAPATAPVRAPAAPPHAYVVTPVPAIGWDGNWPALAAGLPLRGVSQQLALQTELIECVAHEQAATFRLRVPVDTLRASGNSEKLTAALQERFPAVRISLDTEIGPVWYTAAAEAKAAREERQRQAEAVVAADPFVQAMERTFGAFIVPGSVKPAAA